MDKFKITKGAVAVVGTAILASLLNGFGESVMDSYIINKGLCAQGDFVCQWWIKVCIVIAAIAIIWIIEMITLHCSNRRIKAVQKEGYFNNRYNAYIDIENSNSDDLRDCFVVLNAIKVKDNEIYRDWNKHLIGTNKQLNWTSFGKQEEKIVRRGKSEKVIVAEMELGKSTKIRFEDGFEIPIDSDSTYIEIAINGKIGNKQIKEIKFSGFIMRIEEKIMIGNPVIKNSQKEDTKNKPPQWGIFNRLYIEPGKLDE